MNPTIDERPAPADCATMADVRKGVDALDRALVLMLAERRDVHAERRHQTHLAIQVDGIDGDCRRTEPSRRVCRDELADDFRVQCLVRRTHESELDLGPGQTGIERPLRMPEACREVGAGGR